jgi:hypothetical protein
MMILNEPVNCKLVIVFLLLCKDSGFIMICFAGYAKRHARKS